MISCNNLQLQAAPSAEPTSASLARVAAPLQHGLQPVIVLPDIADTATAGALPIDGTNITEITTVRHKIQ
jgi:hypothetical protein